MASSPLLAKRTRIPIGGTFFTICQLPSVDPLLDRMSPEHIQDERFPYYGELWPASIGLARWAWRLLSLHKKRVLDLGCGLGLAGIVAAKKGAQVTLLDYFPQALDLAQRNAEINQCHIHKYLCHDWRLPLLEQFDYILGADILYETRNHEPILRLLKSTSHAKSHIILADPGRSIAKPFFDKAKEFFKQQEYPIRVLHEKLTLTITVVALSPKQ